MKVKIGKYPNHRFYHNFLYEKFGYEAKQNVSVKIDPWDTWSMDHTLAHIIVPMLKQLKETKHGAPHVDDCDVPDWMTSDLADRIEPRENEWDTDAYWFDRWEWVLGEMIWAFEQKNIDWEEQYYKYESDPNETFGMKLVWKDEDALRRHETRMRNGFKLFGKYYQNLWD